MAIDVRGKKKITPYNVFILMFIGLGSMSYGYTASIIGTTLGSFPRTPTVDSFNKLRSANIHRVFQPRNEKQWHRSHLDYEWPLSNWWSIWSASPAYRG
jgi:hypothetical protein